MKSTIRGPVVGGWRGNRPRREIQPERIGPAVGVGAGIGKAAPGPPGWTAAADQGQARRGPLYSSKDRNRKPDQGPAAQAGKPGRASGRSGGPIRGHHQIPPKP